MILKFIINNKKYKIKIIWNNIIYIKKFKNNYLLKFNYFIFKKNYLKKEKILNFF